MKMGYYTKKDLTNKNYAVLSYDYEENCYYIESLHVEKEKATKKWKYLVNQEKSLMARKNGWYAIDYFIVAIGDEKIKKCFNYEMEAE